MIICHQHRFVMIEVPRTASRAMRASLTATFTCQLRRGKQSYHTAALPAECVDYSIVAAVRNPYPRIYAHYKCMSWGQNPKTFSQYLDIGNDHLRFWMRSNGVDRLDEVIRFEDLPDSFGDVFAGLTGCRPRLGRAGEHLSEDWRAAYTAELAEKVQQFASYDFEAFGYDPGGWRPDRGS